MRRSKRPESASKGAYFSKRAQKPKSRAPPCKAQKRDFGQARARPWRLPETSNLCSRLAPPAFGWRSIFSSNGPNSAETRTPRKRDLGTFRDFGQNRVKIDFSGEPPLEPFPGSTRLETASNQHKTPFWVFEKKSKKNYFSRFRPEFALYMPSRICPIGPALPAKTGSIWPILGKNFAKSPDRALNSPF